jgi:hypothetical protein
MSFKRRNENLTLGQRHVRTAIELQTDVLVTLGTRVVDGRLGHQSFHGKLGHRVVTIAARQIVSLVD